MSALYYNISEIDSFRDLTTNDVAWGIDVVGLPRELYDFSYAYSSGNNWVLFRGSKSSANIPKDLQTYPPTLIDNNVLSWHQVRFFAGPGGKFYWVGWEMLGVEPNINNPTAQQHNPTAMEVWEVFQSAPPVLVWSGSRPVSLGDVRFFDPNDFYFPWAPTTPEHCWMEVDGTSIKHFEPGHGVVSYSNASSFTPSTFASTPDLGTMTGGLPRISGMRLGALLPGKQVVSVSGKTYTFSDGSTTTVADSPGPPDHHYFTPDEGQGEGHISVYNAAAPEAPALVWQDFKGAAKEYPY